MNEVQHRMMQLIRKDKNLQLMLVRTPVFSSRRTSTFDVVVQRFFEVLHAAIWWRTDWAQVV